MNLWFRRRRSGTENQPLVMRSPAAAIDDAIPATGLVEEWKYKKLSRGRSGDGEKYGEADGIIRREWGGGSNNRGAPIARILFFLARDDRRLTKTERRELLRVEVCRIGL